MKPALPEDAQVFISHLRWFEDDDMSMWTKAEAKKLGLRGPAKGRGGLTLVQIEFADGRTLVGSARCNPNDNFNKARGRMIAIGRALKKLEQS